MHCSSCGKELGPEDNFCPGCGKNKNPSEPIVQPTPVSSKPSHKNTWVWIFSFTLIFWLFSKCSDYVISAPSSRPSTETNTLRTWRYDESKDPMTSSITKAAMIESTNEVEFKFPYSGKQRMALILRKKGSIDGMISVDRGQFMCHVTEDCYVKFRFDEGKAENFQVGLSSDHSTTVLFIRNPGRLISKLKKAKTVRIESTFYQEGNVVFEFNTQGFEWK